LATLGWHFSVAGTFFNDIAYKTMLLSGIEGTLFNLDPLIKADGYYALSQYLEVDSLREDSFAYLRAWASKYLLFEDVELPAASRRHRRVYLIYGSIALIYSTALLTLSLFFMNNVFVGKLGNWGYPVTFVVAYLLLIRRLRKGFSAMRRWTDTKKEILMTWKITMLQKLVCLVVLVVFFVLPIPFAVSTDLILEPQKEADLRAEIPGIVHTVKFRSGDTVSAGQVVALLENSEINAQAQVLMQQLTMTESNLREAQSRYDVEKAAEAERESVRLTKELEIAQKKVEALEIRSQLNGIVETPGIQQRVGEFLAAGDVFCHVVNRTRMKARILVKDIDLDQVHIGSPVTVKVLPFPYRTFSGRVEQILPAAAAEGPVAQAQKLERLGQELTNYFAVIMEFPNAEGNLLEGMTGTAKISGKSRPLAYRAGQAVWRWAHSQIW
jgi:putative peptide zinc metalloprotease protein